MFSGLPRGDGTDQRPDAVVIPAALLGLDAGAQVLYGVLAKLVKGFLGRVAAPAARGLPEGGGVGRPESRLRTLRLGYQHLRQDLHGDKRM